MSTDEHNRDDIKELYQICNKTLGQLQAVQAQIDAAIKMQEYINEEHKEFKQEQNRTLNNRFKLYEDHEIRLRKLEEWKARSTAYWLIAATVLTAVMGIGAEFIMPM